MANVKVIAPGEAPSQPVATPIRSQTTALPCMVPAESPSIATPIPTPATPVQAVAETPSPTAAQVPGSQKGTEDATPSAVEDEHLTRKAKCLSCFFL